MYIPITLFAIADFLSLLQLQFMIGNGQNSASKCMLILLPLQMSSKYVQWVPLHTGSDREANPVFAFIVLAQTSEIDWTLPTLLSWYHYSFVVVAIDLAPELNIAGYK